MKRQVFQTLPPLVIREIINYTAEPSVESKHSPSEPAIHYNVFQPLLYTCHSWRALTLAQLLAQFEINISSKTSISFLVGESSKQTTRYLNQCYTEYVKAVYVKVGFKSIADGSALTRMQNIILDTVCFSGVRRLHLELSLTDEEPMANAQSMQHTDKFVQYIESLTPAIVCVDLHIHSDRYYGKYFHSGQVGTLFRTLLSADSKITANITSSPQPIYYERIFIRELTVVACNWDEHFEKVAQVLHANSKTLERIQIYYHSTEGLERLFIDKNGKPVIYSYLKGIILSKVENVVVKQLPNFGQFAPFPSLELLYMDIEYTFSDDILFRGNRKTLKNVFIQADYNIMSALDKYGTFSKKRQSYLETLTISPTVYNINFPETATDKYMEFLSRAIPHVRKLRINDMLIAEALPRHLSDSNISNNIQLLVLSCYFKLPKLLQLIQLLPTLQVLRCMIADLGSRFSSKSAVQIADIMHAEFDLTKSCLKRWIIINDGYFPCNPIVISILVAASMCSQLDTMQFTKQKPAPIAQLFRRLQSSKLYASYKPRFTPVLVENSQSPMIYVKRHIPLSQITETSKII